ncbi:N-acetyl-gamma-glutamyl-phosphate reductase [Fodinicurvata sp. EGI_FJ10296]|uniref:N-acetyl-gamma-glutamyl-phosphate reductase n=1 Tax=Fodinicurvata sp. EGI_FJ10296 TaxID=3231908 RepID=UPI0034544581
MTATVFIDGSAGTTGLQLMQRLAGRTDLQILELPDADRKDRDRRAAAINDADIAVLCLPDDAARESVSLIRSDRVKVIDTSTAHRVDPEWAYGFPEMEPDQAERIAGSGRVANPGCYPTGAVALLRPLVGRSILPPDFPVTVNAVSGYTGGGKAMVARFEDPDHSEPLTTPFRVYGLGLDHKHVPEIRVHGLLSGQPIFVPSVGRFRQGMIVQVPLQLRALSTPTSPGAIAEVLVEHYRGYPAVSVFNHTVEGPGDGASVLDVETLVGTNDLHLHVFGSTAENQVVLAAVLDNLGKGASGAAVQNLNLLLGVDPQTGLTERLSDPGALAL